MTAPGDLFGHDTPERGPVKQLGLNLGMGVTIRWGGTSFRVSVDAGAASTCLSPPDLPDLGPRWAEALKLFYPGRKPGELDHKRCAIALGVEPRTAEGWAAGQPPRGEYLWRAFRRHGRAFLVALAPELSPPTEAELLTAAASLRTASAELADAIAKLAEGRAP